MDSTPPTRSFQTFGTKGSMMYICNRTGTVVVEYEPELLEWLQQRYPFSGYHLVEVEHESVS
jgi:hypothetical protein